MLRYLGPKLKKLKRLNISIQPGLTVKYLILERKLLRRDSIIVSCFFTELLEKQRLKVIFSLTEKSIRKYLYTLNKYFYRRFSVINLFKMRLDVVLFSIGYNISILQARQWIVHGHFLVNFIVIRNPGFLLKKGDIINIFSVSFFLFKICKGNFYNKYRGIVFSYNNIIICLKTMSSMICSLKNIQCNFIYYNKFLILQYYKV